MPSPVQITRRRVLQISAGLIALPALAQSGPRAEEIRRVHAPEASQGVAVDERYLYAIDNRAIGKYDKRTGQPLARWECERDKPLIHLNSGVVHDGVLWCAHSNFPGVPMTSSIETWDTETLQPASTYSFGIYGGSATWVDLYQDRRFVNFTHYKTDADEAGRDPRWTTLIEFDVDWLRRGAWVYPAEIVSELGSYSISGGVFTPDGKLYCTGHDNAEVYVFTFPKQGSTLVHEDTIPMPMHGQGIALDPSDPNLLYGIDRPQRQIVVTHIRSA